MPKKTLIAALAILALAVPASAIAAGDPVSAVKADLAKLSSDVKTAHDGLIADLGKITTDAQNGDVSSVKTDVAAFRSDRQSLMGPVRSDLEQLKTDLRAAKAAQVDPSSLMQLIQDARSANRAAREDVKNAVQTARAAVKALRGAHSSK